jgi:predicted O-methyltransferase YrrM
MTPEEIREARVKYLAMVDDPRYTISQQMAEYLNSLIEERRPVRVLDIGSGLSSAIFRANGIEAWTFDEDPKWAARTREFLAAQGLNTSHVFSSLDTNDHIYSRQYDLVLLDAGYEIHRQQLFRKAVSLVNPGGLLVLDDGNWPEMQRMARVYSKIQEYPYSQMPELADEYGRFPITIELKQAPKQQPVCICLAIPRALVCYDEAFMSFMRIAQQGWALVDLPSCPVPLARDQFGRHLLTHPEFTHTVMLDQDHVHPVDIVHQLARLATLNRDKWVIGGLNHRRGEPFDPAAYWQDETKHYYTVGLDKWGTELREVDALGMGAVIFTREVFEIFGPTWFGYDYDRVNLNIYPSDDTSFSQRAQAAGIKLWCQPTLCSPHLFMEKVDHEYFNKWLHEHQDRIDAEGNLSIGTPGG